MKKKKRSPLSNVKKANPILKINSKNILTSSKIKSTLPLGWQSRKGFTWIYKLLEIPWIYNFSQSILGLGYDFLLREKRKEVFGKSKGYILDIGCGPRMVVPPPKSGVVVGVDVNPEYLLSYTNGFIDQDPNLPFKKSRPNRWFGYLADGQSLPFKKTSFDEIRTSSFLHHLKDEAVVKTLIEANRCLKSKGHLISFEPVWPKNKWTRPLAWLILSFDRGYYMRSQEDLSALLSKNLPGTWHFHRMTHTFTGLECLWSIFKKS